MDKKLKSKGSKSRINVIDSSIQNRKKPSYEVNNYREANEIGSSTNLRNEYNIEDRFNSLLDKFNKSKERLDNLNQISTGDKSSTKLGLISPTQSNYKTTPRVFPYDTKKSLHTGIKTNGFNENISQSRHFESRNDDFDRLESNLLDFKNEILDRLKSSPERSRIKLDKKKQLLISDDDEDEDNNGNDVSDNERFNDNRRMLKSRDLAKDLTSNRSTKPSKSQKKYKKMDLDEVNNGDNLNEEFVYTDRMDDNADKDRKRTSKSINKLKSVMQIKEKLDYDKYLALKSKAKELKNILREYVNKVIDLESNLKKKDQTIIELKEELKGTQHELRNNVELLQEFKKLTSEGKKSEEDLKASNIEYKVKLNDQKKKLERLEDNLKQNEEKYLKDLESLRLDYDKLKKELGLSKEKESSLIEKNEELKGRIEELQNELESRKNEIIKLNEINENKGREIKDINEELEKYILDNKHLNVRLEDTKNMVAHLEEKNAKLKKKTEEEKTKISDELQKKLDTKHEKVKALKTQLKELESVLNKLEEDNKDLSLNGEKLTTVKSQLEKELSKLRDDLSLANHEITLLRTNNENLKRQNDEILKNIHAESEKSKTYQTDNKKLVNILEITEEKLSYYETENKNLDDIVTKLKLDIKSQLDENTKLKEQISKLEKQYNFMNTQQNAEISKVENSLNEFAIEMKKIKEENVKLKANEGEFIKELELYKLERDKCKKEYKTLKQINRIFERDLREIEDKVKGFILDKNQELEEQTKDKIMQKHLNSKIKVLEDIQDMIKTHKTNFKSQVDLTNI